MGKKWNEIKLQIDFQRNAFDGLILGSLAPWLLGSKCTVSVKGLGSISG